MRKIKFEYRHQYDEEMDDLIGGLTSIDNEPSPLDAVVTQQQFEKETNLNVLMRRMGQGDKAIPPQAIDVGYFGDFSEPLDLRQSLDRVREAQERFNALPVDMRKRFGHDPRQLWEFVNNPENHEEAIKMKLLHKTAPPPKAAPQEVRIVADDRALETPTK